MYIYALSGIGTRDPNNREAAALTLRPHGQWDRPHPELFHPISHRSSSLSLEQYAELFSFSASLFCPMLGSLLRITPLAKAEQRVRKFVKEVTTEL
jgi:hypothetical protein